ncbi:MAG: winged helix-turn-helix domain-containing protein [Candidatus Eremiobacteraeota bacterium]|nr:winged helix-turn-helix domain-containing protein [Candidatus Eremiobacteraeota bacterium]
MYTQVSFGRFIFHLTQRKLWYDGLPVTLKPKEAEFLAVLGERRPEIATRDEIIERLWMGSASDAALNQTVYRLRQTLARYDSSAYIETVPERGFRLAGESPIDAHKHRPDALRPAFSLFQKAVSLYRQRSESAILQAIELLERACEDEPEYVPALETLASAYCNAGVRLFYPPLHAYWRARTLIERVITIDPSSSRAFATLSTLLLFFNANRSDARLAAERAILLRPNGSVAHSAAVWERLSRRDYIAALTQADLAVTAAPASSHSTALFGTALYMARRYDEAHHAFETARALDDNHAMAIFYDGCAYAMQGEFRKADETFAMIGGSDMSTRVIAARGYVAAKRGDTAGARRAMSTLRTATIPSHVSLCAVQLAMNDHAGAAATLEHALHTREPGLFLTVVDPMYAPLQHHYPALIAAIERGRPEQCDRCGTELKIRRLREIHQLELCWDCRRNARPFYLDGISHDSKATS